MFTNLVQRDEADGEAFTTITTICTRHIDMYTIFTILCCGSGV